MHKKMECLAELKNEMIDDLKAKKDHYSVEKAGEIVDMIKDITEAEEKCMKACYYKELICAMDDERADAGGERMGYSNRRYSSGRFAPKGRGHIGYTPTHMDGPYMRMMEDPYDWGQGYTPSGAGNRSQSGSRMGYTDDRRGRTWNDYQDSLRHYTETRDPQAKKGMEQRADEHVREATESIKDIWRDADPEMKTRLKSQMTKLIEEMR